MDIKKDQEGNYLAYPKLHREFSAASSSSSNGIYISPIGKSKIEKGEKIEVELLVNRAHIEEVK